MEQLRLQVYMAKCGVASRRKSEEMILAGRVSVNGQVVDTLGFKVSSSDEVKVDGKAIKREELVYYALNKPSGYVTTLSDEFNRKKITDLLLEEDKDKRVFPVGRLDYDTEGVILLTNDGELANILTKSGSNVEKEYLARVSGKLTKEEVKKLTNGVVIDDYKTKKAKVYVEKFDKENNSSMVRIIITEGKNHQVKKMFASVGHEVKHLTRIRFATIDLTNIGKGYYRMLKPHEVKQLYKFK